jgi:flagellar hook-associated protein 3 FlgL
MTITPFAAGSVVARRSGDLFVTLRSDLADLQRQLATGQKSESYGGLGFDRRTSLSIRAKISAMDGWRDNIKMADLRIKLMSNGVEGLAAIGRNTKAALMPGGFELGGDGRTLAQASAEQSLRSALDILNMDMNGRYLFSGRSTDTLPVETFDRIMNGDGATGAAGLRQMISERQAADSGVAGNGRVAVSAAGPTVTLGRTDTSPFGFGLASVSSSSGVVTLSQPTGAPPSMGLTVTGTPTDGDVVSFTLNLPDGTQTTLSLTAFTDPLKASGDHAFVADANPAVTAANIAAKLGALVAFEARTSLTAASAIQTATDFFSASTTNQNPPRVAAPVPPATYADATAFAAPGSRPTLIWYAGDDASTPSARDTAAIRVDETQVVGTGARANEPAIVSLLAQLGAVIGQSFGTSGQDQARYEALADRARTNLSPSLFQPNVEDIAVELGNAAAAMNAAKEKHNSVENMLLGTLDEVENAKPEEVGAAILALQTRLQASYQATSILSQLSLVNYL